MSERTRAQWLAPFEAERKAKGLGLSELRGEVVVGVKVVVAKVG